MSRTRRISDETQAVLRLFVDQPEQERFGLEVLNEAGLASGSLYPILHRLEARGILKSRWEPLDVATAASRRPRRLYMLDPRGASAAKELLAAWEHATQLASRRHQRLREQPT